MELFGTKLFARQVRLVVGCPIDPNLKVTAALNEHNAEGKDLSGLDIEFHVSKSLRPDQPNTAKISVYNLSESNRQALSGGHPLTVKLEAGYAGGMTQIYFATVRAAWTESQGPDFVTHIESTDAARRPSGLTPGQIIPPGLGSAQTTQGRKVELVQAFKSLTAAMGIGAGNSDTALAQQAGITGVNGGALVGNSAAAMTNLCRSAGFEWSIQDGALQLLRIGKPINPKEALELSADSGLIGSPSVDSKGVLTFTALMIPGLAPGALVSVKSLFVSGGYRIEKIEFTGNTASRDWYAKCSCFKY